MLILICPCVRHCPPAAAAVRLRTGMSTAQPARRRKQLEASLVAERRRTKQRIEWKHCPWSSFTILSNTHETACPSIHVSVSVVPGVSQARQGAVVARLGICGPDPGRWHWWPRHRHQPAGSDATMDSPWSRLLSFGNADPARFWQPRMRPEGRQPATLTGCAATATAAALADHPTPGDPSH